MDKSLEGDLEGGERIQKPMEKLNSKADGKVAEFLCKIK
jgi:hypothetical protein